MSGRLRAPIMVGCLLVAGAQAASPGLVRIAAQPPSPDQPLALSYYWFARVTGGYLVRGVVLRPALDPEAAPCPTCPASRDKPPNVVLRLHERQNPPSLVVALAPADGERSGREWEINGRRKGLLRRFAEVTVELLRVAYPAATEGELAAVLRAGEIRDSAWASFVQGIQAAPVWPDEGRLWSSKPLEAEAARSHFLAALKADAHCAPAALGLALVALHTDGLPAGVDELAARANPDMLWLHPHYLFARAIGQYCRPRGIRIRDHAEYLRRLVELAPQDRRVRDYCASIISIAMPEEAVSLYDDITAQEPCDVRALLNKALAFEDAEDYEGMLAAVKKAEECGGGSAFTRKLKAEALARIGRLEEATALLEPLVAADPTNLYLRADLGTAYAKGRQFDKAIALAQDTERVLPEQANNTYHHIYLASLCERADDLEHAREHWTRAVELDPGRQLEVNWRRYFARQKRLGLEPSLQAKVTVDSFGRPLEDVLAEIEKKAGVSLHFLGTFRGEPIFLHVQDATVWECMKQVADQLDAKWDLLFDHMDDEPPTYRLWPKLPAKPGSQKKPCPTCP